MLNKDWSEGLDVEQVVSKGNKGLESMATGVHLIITKRLVLLRKCIEICEKSLKL